MKVIVIFSIAIFVQSFYLDRIDFSISEPFSISSQAQSASSLQSFRDVIGQNFGDTQYRSLLNFIYQAASQYKDDIFSNTRDIAERMTNVFGDTIFSYGVIIQKSKYSITGVNVYSGSYNTKYASLPPGVNGLYPQWSYYVYTISTKTLVNTNYVGKGSGISDEKHNQIKNYIFSYDGTDICECKNTGTISYMLKQRDEQFWNIVCQTNFSIYAHVPVKDSQWDLLHPNQCYYLVYAIS